MESGALLVLDVDGTITCVDDDRDVAYWAHGVYGTDATYRGNTINRGAPGAWRRHRGLDDN